MLINLTDNSCCDSRIFSLRSMIKLTGALGDGTKPK